MPTPPPTDRLPLRRLGPVAMCLMMVFAGCDGDELRDPTVGLPAPPTSTTTSTTNPTATTSPSTTSSVVTAAADRTIEIDQLSSPANATAEMTGSGALAADGVTVDGEPADVLSFRADEQGTFVLQVWIEDEGAHTVCVADVCGRVYTLAPDAESPEEIIAKMEAAIPLAQDYLDYPTLFPEWQVEIGGALAGTGGTTDLETKTVTIHRNRGRTIDDFVRTLLHEFGHVADFELLDDRERAAYLELRGLDAAAAWRDTSAHGSNDWGQQPGEDFAEVMVAIWSSGRWSPRTEIAADPTLAELATILDLVGSPVG